MKTDYILLFFTLLYFVLRMCPLYEGFIPTKMDVSNLQPDNRQFKVMGQNNYKQTNNPIKNPYSGFYTSLLKVTGNKRSSNNYKTPLTQEKEKDEPYNYFNNNNVIDHDNNRWNPLVDPFSTYAHPLHQYGILYPVEQHGTFLEEYDKHINEILKRKQIEEIITM